MRIQSYLGILSIEASLRALHSEIMVPHSTIKETKARRGRVSDDVWWNWQTQRVRIVVENPDDGFRALLHSHRPIFPMVRKVVGPETDVYLELVMQYEKGQQPRALHLSADSVLLLSEMGV